MSLQIKSAKGSGGYPGRVPMGDPGLFGSIWGGIKKIGGGALKVGSSFIPGPIGGAIRYGMGRFSGGGGGTPAPIAANPKWAALNAAIGPCGPGMRRDASGTCVVPAMLYPMPAPPPPQIGASGATLAMAQANGNGCPSGYHLNKSSYFLRDGSYIEAYSRCVKNRRRNPSNPQAMSTAIRRIDSGKKFQHVMAQIETGKYSKAGNKKACATCK